MVPGKRKQNKSGVDTINILQWKKKQTKNMADKKNDSRRESRFLLRNRRRRIREEAKRDKVDKISPSFRFQYDIRGPASSHQRREKGEKRTREVISLSLINKSVTPKMKKECQGRREKNNISFDSLMLKREKR